MDEVKDELFAAIDKAMMSKDVVRTYRVLINGRCYDDAPATIRRETLEEPKTYADVAALAAELVDISSASITLIEEDGGQSETGRFYYIRRSKHLRTITYEGEMK